MRVEYETLVELGVFENQPVELLEGHVVEMSPQGDGHVAIVANLHFRIARALPENLRVRAHSGLRAGPRSMPEPDIAVALHRGGWYQFENALFVVEVAFSSLRNDRDVKAKMA